MVSEIQQLDFLRDRIHEIRSALFANTSNEAFKLPTCIISALNIDNEGQICFFIHRPDLYMEEYDMEFPAKLDFYRKGKPFFLKISGQAQIIADKDEMLNYIGLPGNVDLPSLSKLLLVKVKVEHAEYFEARHKHQWQWNNWWKEIWHFFSRSRNNPRPHHALNLRPAA